MKQFILWTFLVSILSLSFGLGITAYQGNFSLKERAIDLSKTASVEDVNLIKVQSSSADIIITPTDEQQISIRYYGTLRSNEKDNPNVEIEKVGKDLKIKSGMPLGFLWYYTAGFDDFKLEVKIPATYHKKLDVQTNFGDIDINSLTLEKVMASTGSKGSVTLDKCEGDQEVNATLGNVTIVDKNLSSHKTIKSTFGDVKLFLPEKSSFSYVFDTNSGNLTNIFTPSSVQNSTEHFSGTVGSGQYNITVKTNSGNLNINKSSEGTQ